MCAAEIFGARISRLCVPYGVAKLPLPPFAENSDLFALCSDDTCRNVSPPSVTDLSRQVGGRRLKTKIKNAPQATS